MNKKLITMSVSVVLGGLLLVTTAFAGLSGASGYDTYKKALITSVMADSVAGQVDVMVKDNGTVLGNAQADFKLDMNDKSMSSDLNLVNKSINFFYGEDQFVIKSSDSDVYKVMEATSERTHNADFDKTEMMASDHVKSMESFADALSTGLLKYVTTNNNIDGTKEVAINLNGSQVPTLLNAMVPVAFNNMGTRMDMEKESVHFVDFPKLVSNIAIQEISFKAQISKDNLLTGQTQTIVITGLDAEGVLHELEATVNVSFTDYNNTTADKIDITGKQVQQIEPSERSHR